MERLAQRLLTQETVNHDDLVDVLGPRPFSSPEYANFLNKQDEELPTVDSVETDSDIEKEKKEDKESDEKKPSTD